jgi:hypothetical protein
MKLTTLLLGLFFLKTIFSVEAASFTGKISGTNDNIVFDQYQMSMPAEFLYTMDDVYLGWDNYFFKVEGELIDNTLVAEQTPTIIAGRDSFTGLFQKVDGQYFIGEQKVNFGRTKEIYNNQFDEISKESFIGKEVRVYGNLGEESFEINSIMVKGLFAAGENSFKAPDAFNRKPLRYILKEMPKNENSQKDIPFRGIVTGKNHTPKAGDPVLIITLSGRQGDAPDTVGGHFAIGMGELDENLEVDGEIFNFYFEGPKEVPAGNTELSSYFGHLIQGQNNYRPTYSVLVYGKTKEELKSVRDAMEEDLHRVRTEEGLGITPMYNCSTSAFKTLAPIGIRGAHEYTLISGKLKAPAKELEHSDNMLLQLYHGVVKPRATYIPRVTFESLVKNVVKRGESMGIKRMDYIFLPQTASKRPVGGISVNGLAKTLKFYNVDRKRDKEVKKYFEALEVLEDENATRFAKWKAKRTVEKYRDDQEFQEIVTELMSKHFKKG